MIKKHIKKIITILLILIVLIAVYFRIPDQMKNTYVILSSALYILIGYVYLFYKERRWI